MKVNNKASSYFMDCQHFIKGKPTSAKIPRSSTPAELDQSSLHSLDETRAKAMPMALQYAPFGCPPEYPCSGGGTKQCCICTLFIHA